jgi:hypothetical protein
VPVSIPSMPRDDAAEDASPRTHQGAVTCERIVRAVARVGFNRGVVATSIEQILTASNASRSQLHRYFANAGRAVQRCTGQARGRIPDVGVLPRARPRGQPLRRRPTGWECRPMQRPTGAARPRSWPRCTAPWLLVVVSLLVLRFRGRGPTNDGCGHFAALVTSPKRRASLYQGQGARREPQPGRRAAFSPRNASGTAAAATTSTSENQHDDRCGKDGE